MKDVNFNYYLSPKEDVIMMLKSYFNAKKQQDEDLERETKHRYKLINEVNMEFDAKIDSVMNLLSENTSEQQKISGEIYQHNKNLNKFLDSKYDNHEGIAFLIVFINIIIMFLFPNLSYNILFNIFISIVLIIISRMRFNAIQKKYRKKFEEFKSSKEEAREEVLKKRCEIADQLSYLREKKSKALDAIPDLTEKIDLRKKFNIPLDIKDHEEFIYNLLINGRANSFNEALDKLEEYKHREYLEEMQYYQCLETGNLSKQLEQDMKNINNRLDYNDRLNNNLLNEINKAQDLARQASLDASSAASSAASAERSAKYNSQTSLF